MDPNGVEGEEDAKVFEAVHVQQVYNEIAPHFSNTRYKAWPKVAEFLSKCEVGAVVVDVGCGNGKNLAVTPPHCVGLGNDRSENLCKIAAEKGHEVLVCDNLSLPYRSASADYAISIAVIHHFATPDRRKRAIEEIMRVVRPGGSALFYVWALEQEKRRYEQQDVFVPWHLQAHYRKSGKGEAGEGGGAKNKKKREKRKKGGDGEAAVCDGGKEEEKEEKKSSDVGEGVEVDGKSESKGAEQAKSSGEGDEEEEGEVVLKRYYHMFVQGELEELVAEVDGCNVMESYFDHANWCCVVRKQ